MEIFLQLHFSFSSENIFKFIKIIFLFRRPTIPGFSIPSFFLITPLIVIRNLSSPNELNHSKLKWQVTFRTTNTTAAKLVEKFPEKDWPRNRWDWLRMIDILLKFKYPNVWHSWPISTYISTANIQDNKSDGRAGELTWTILGCYQEQCICVSVTM